MGVKLLELLSALMVSVVCCNYEFLIFMEKIDVQKLQLVEARILKKKS